MDEKQREAAFRKLAQQMGVLAIGLRAFAGSMLKLGETMSEFSAQLEQAMEKADEVDSKG
jgi:hypothetical protein